MVRQWWKQCVVASALCGAASFAVAQESVPLIKLRLAEQGDEAIALTEENTAADPLLEKSLQNKFWLGVSCNPINESLKAQLNRTQGLLVEQVVADSPAAKANLHEHDILLKYNDAELATVEQLLEAVEKHGAKEVTLTILRGGKEETCQVTIVERPAAVKASAAAAVRAAAEAEQEQEMEKALRLLRDQNKNLELMFVRPGVAFAPERIKPAEWPKDVTVKVLKIGDQPATFEIKRGDKTWKVTEDKIIELPADIRLLVEQMRGNRMKIRVEDRPGSEAVHEYHLFTNPGSLPLTRIQPLPAIPGVPMSGAARIATTPSPHITPQPNPLQDVHKKLDMILQRMQGEHSIDKLEQEVDRLRRDVESLRDQIKK